MSRRAVIKLAGFQPREINGKTIRPGQTLIEGVCAEGLMVPDLVLALRTGQFQVVEVEDPKRKPERVPVGTEAGK